MESKNRGAFLWDYIARSKANLESNFKIYFGNYRL